MMSCRRLAAACTAAIAAALAGCATPPLPAGGDAQAAASVQAAASAASAAAEADRALPPAEAASAAVAAVPLPADTAAAAVTPVDPLRPEVPVDLEDRSARIDLWQRVRDGLAMPDLDNERVREMERWYAQRPDYVQRMTERGGKYLFHIVEEVQRRGLPTELALLPFIESAFNPQAMSVAKASGMWQFMPGTGRDFDLKQNLFRDDRRDVLASTRAALDYLTRLNEMFGDWHLALAAYNWGEGNVQRALARNRKAGKATDYDSLRMPNETRYYLPKLQAVKNIVLRPGEFQLALPELANHPYFLSVPIERDIDVEVAARLADLPLEEFHALNPQLNKPVILAAGTPQVLLPYDNANAFVRNLAGHAGPLASWTAWVAQKTLKPAEVARIVGMPEEHLREVNRIPPRMLVKAGSTLLVPRAPQREADVSEHIADNAAIVLAPDGPRLQRRVVKVGRKGDSVTALARRHGVSAAQVAQWNSVSVKGRFKAGESVVLFLAPRRAAASPQRSAARKSVTPRARATAKVPKSTNPPLARKPR